jgi:hypothetical protein
VLYTSQTLTEQQKAQARTNIGAASTEDISTLARIFIGTREQYNTANAKGEIPVGTIVIILDENIDLGSTSAILGQAILGQLILG